MRVFVSRTFEKLQGLINMLFRLELVVVNKLTNTILVENISLSSWQSAEQVRRDTPFFPDLVTLVT